MAGNWTYPEALMALSNRTGKAPLVQSVWGDGMGWDGVGSTRTGKSHPSFNRYS